MRRILPYPLLWLSLLVMWLLLSGNFGLADVLLGAAVASLASWAVVKLEPPKPALRRIGAIFEVLGYFLRDVVRSNLDVLRLIVSGREPRSAFVEIPLELTDPNGLAILACIVTATPGSAWIQHDSALRRVTIHVLHVEDDAQWVATFKRHYEQRLVEILQ